MLASKIINIIGLFILVNNVRTQNNDNTTILTIVQARRVQKPGALFDDEAIPKKKIYDPDKIDSLFQQHASYIGINKLSRNDAEKHYVIFYDNVMLINQLFNFYTTARFSINAYTHLNFDEFTNGYTGFNGTGLTDDDVILFNRSIVQDTPPMMDWSGEDMLQTYVQDTKCKNSYLYSALSE